MLELSKNIQLKASLGEDETTSSFPSTGFYSICWKFDKQICSVWAFSLQRALELFLSLKIKNCSLLYFSPEEGQALKIFKKKYYGGKLCNKKSRT